MRTTVTGTAFAVAAALALSACGSSGGGHQDGAAAHVSASPQKPAIPLDHPKPKPHLVLTDTSGKKYDLAKETRGRPTLLYFGYTNCPDVCPVVMSDLGIAVKKLSKAERKKLRVVFVSTDPADDTPKRIRRWLDMQGGQDFVGLTGDFAAVKAAAKPLGILVAKAKKDKDGKVTADHGAEVIAFSPKDNKAHWIYTSDTTANQYAKDLPKIVQGEAP